MKLIIGLGNPGKRYANTRHNVGFMALDTLHNQLHDYDISNWQLSKKFNAEMAGCTISAEKVLLAKPMTFMNKSGESVQLIAHYYKIAPSDIIVVHDDKDLELGEIKVQTKRGHAGHNGIKSIIKHIGSKDFTRIRCGVAPKKGKKIKDTAKFVLGKFSLFEKKHVNQLLTDAVYLIRKELGLA